jgi:hypothetical protein
MKKTDHKALRQILLGSISTKKIHRSSPLKAVELHHTSLTTLKFTKGITDWYSLRRRRGIAS